MQEPVTPALQASGGHGQTGKKQFSLRRLWREAHGVSPFASNVAVTVGANIVIALSGLLTGPICARLLGPTGRGELAALQNLYWLVAVFAMLGAPEATLYFTAQSKNDSGRILASSLLLVFLASPLFISVFLLITPLFMGAQGASLVRSARWFLLGIPLYAMSMIPLSTLRGRNEIAWWNLLRLAPTLGWFLLLAGLGIFARATPLLVAVGYLAVLGVTLAPTLLFLRHRISDFRPEPSYWPRMLKYGVPLALASIPFTLNVRLDQIMMAALLSARPLGIYVVAVSWSGAVPPILLAVGTILFPRLAGADIGDRGRLFTQGTRVSVFIAVMLACVLAALTPLGIPLLFGKAFADSVHVGVILVFAGAILGINMVFEEGLRGIGETKTVLIGELAGLSVTALLLALLLPRYGILGGGIATLLGFSTTALALLWRISATTNEPIKEVLLLRAQDLKLIGTKLRAMRTISFSGGEDDSGNEAK